MNKNLIDGLFIVENRAVDVAVCLKKAEQGDSITRREQTRFAREKSETLANAAAQFIDMFFDATGSRLLTVCLVEFVSVFIASILSTYSVDREMRRDLMAFIHECTD